jgi:hypothetical protein
MAMTFQVNLATVNLLNSKQPYGSDNGSNFPTTRSTWFPNSLLNNRALKHGDTFTASGSDAIYLKNNFTTGTFKFLDYVSGTAT